MILHTSLFWRQSQMTAKLTWRQTAVTAYLKSKRLLLFDFELQDSLLPSSTGILTVVQRQTAVTAYLKSKQLLLSLHVSIIGCFLSYCVYAWWRENGSLVAEKSLPLLDAGGAWIRRHLDGRRRVQCWLNAGPTLFWEDACSTYISFLLLTGLFTIV